MSCDWVPNLSYLDGFDLAAAFPDLRVGLGHDAQLALLAEVEAGAARGLSDAILLAIGTGIGSAVLAGGRIIRGSTGAACSFGWAVADLNDAGDERLGWLERNASGRALCRGNGRGPCRRPRAHCCCRCRIKGRGDRARTPDDGARHRARGCCRASRSGRDPDDRRCRRRSRCHRWPNPYGDAPAAAAAPQGDRNPRRGFWSKGEPRRCGVRRSLRAGLGGAPWLTRPS